MLADLPENLSGIYWFAAIFGSALLVIQFVVTCIGVCGDTDVPDGDSCGDAPDCGDIAELKLLSMKSVTAFIAFSGWGGIFWGQGWSGILISFGCGILMMLLVSLAVWGMLRMQQSGNISNEDFIGCRGKVYLSIPGGRSQKGKVTVCVKNRTREIAAVSDEPAAAGTEVIVAGTLGMDLFLVRPDNGKTDLN